MEKGDLSNITPPRFLFVFEGLIGKLTPENEKKERFNRRFRRWQKAMDCWDIDDAGLAYLWDLAWRWHMQVDIATFLPYHRELDRRLDEEGVPYGTLKHYAAPETLAMRLAYMPYVARVYYAYPERRFIFGDRGVYMPDEAIFDPLGG